MYVQDPLCNLLEMYCPDFADANTINNTHDVRDVTSVAALDYAWDPTVATLVPRGGVLAGALARS